MNGEKTQAGSPVHQISGSATSIRLSKKPYISLKGRYEQTSPLYWFILVDGW